MSDNLRPPVRYEGARQENNVIKQGPRKFRMKDLFVDGAFDLVYFSLVVILLLIGLVMLFSASYPYAQSYKTDSFEFIRKQLIFSVVGVIGMLIVSRINHRVLGPLLVFLIPFTYLCLVIVLFKHTNVPGGFKRWIPIGGFSFQPSDVAKFTLVVMLAFFMSHFHGRMKNMMYSIVYPLVMIGSFCVLIYLEHHLSCMILMFLIGASIMFCAGTDWWLFIAGLAAVVVLAAFVLKNPQALPEHAVNRVVGFVNKDFSPDDVRWQTNNSLYAIGSGGLLGVGLGNSKQKFLYVSEPQNDFIFSIVCEELGFIGAAIIIALFAALFIRGMQIAKKNEDDFGKYLVIGITAQTALQVVFNILVVTDSVPNTGIALPFFSAGGTAIMMQLLEMGVVLSVSRKTNQKNIV